MSKAGTRCPPIDRSLRRRNILLKHSYCAQERAVALWAGFKWLVFVVVGLYVAYNDLVNIYGAE
jgi:hypothetical protein